jgi:hypothetical protein
MRTTRGTVVGALALAGTFALCASGWAQTAATERAALRAKTEKQISQLQEKAAAARPADQVGEVHARIANRLIEMAQKALGCNNERVAKELADQADRMLNLAVPEKAVQQ